MSWVVLSHYGPVDEKRVAFVFARDTCAALIIGALDRPHLRLRTRAEFVAARLRHDPAIAFVEADLIPLIEGETTKLVVVAIVDDTLAEAVRSLSSFPWLSHLVTVAMLAMPRASVHLERLIEQLEHGPTQHVMGTAGVGRVALLAASSRREARFERMREFFSTQGMTARTVTLITDVAEELVTNALYDAPAEAGYFKTPVARTSDVDLPPEHACEISYGIEQGSAFVRIRDPFGALGRDRVIGVLNRCNATDVALDESRGGAGLGLWRVFSSASTISITVIPGRLTDILVRIETKKGRSIGKSMLAIHMFFPDELALDGAQSRFAADHDADLMDDSFTALGMLLTTTV